MANDEPFETRSDAPDLSENPILKAATRPGEALTNAIGAVVNAPDLPTGILRGGAELLGAGWNMGGDVLEAAGADVSGIPNWTGESAEGMVRTTLGGDEGAKDTPITTRGGESTTLGGEGVKTPGEVAEGVKEGFWNSLPEDVRAGLSGLGRTAMLGALSELWGAANRSLSSPLEAAGNAINQVVNTSNKLDI